jgi:hypothetical protein
VDEPPLIIWFRPKSAASSMTAASVLNVREAIQEMLLWQTENLPLGVPSFHLLAAPSDGDATSLDQPITPRK